MPSRTVRARIDTSSQRMRSRRGQNLQDCDCVVNYDVHWNPVRLVQRFGRVDRLGSTNEHIQMVTFWPDVDLESYINLESRVKSRMALGRCECLRRGESAHPVGGYERPGVSLGSVAHAAQ